MICLDSDCVIDYLKGKKEAVEIVYKYSNEIATTEIAVFEVFYGIYSKPNVSEKEETIARDFFNSIAVFPFSRGCGLLSSKIISSLMKEGSLIEQNDCFIAAIILRQGFNRIITKNKKHFSRIKGLKVLEY